MKKTCHTCICCKKSEFSTVYQGPIRSGSFGKVSEESYSVLECLGCNLKFLDPVPLIDYELDEYRLSYNDSCQEQDYLRMHDHEQNERLQRIGVENFRGKTVLDFGCGGGSFLDCIKGLAAKTIAVEPYSGFHAGLVARGHEVFSSASEAIDLYSNRIDILISFGVIEHTENPLVYLEQAKSFLSESGKLFLETDNSDDFLMQLDLPEFKKFFYRTAHYWYFDPKSMMEILKVAGFTNPTVDFRHNYDLSNAFMWMKDKIPTGTGSLVNISKNCDLSWKNFLEQSGQADLLFCSCEKNSAH
mgnify:CR=1 FL=1